MVECGFWDNLTVYLTFRNKGKLKHLQLPSLCFVTLPRKSQMAIFSLRRWFIGFLLVLQVLSACSPYKLCPIPGCQVHMLHAHSGVTFRGQPWWRIKKQNPKVGQEFVYTKDNNVVKKGKKKKKDEEKKTNQMAAIKARDPSKRGDRDKDFDVEEPEEDTEEKEGE